MRTSTINVTTTRGDTDPIVFTFLDSTGAPIDVTGNTFLLTVNQEEKPNDVTNQVFQLTGSILDASGGRVSFSMDSDQADQFGVLYYDIQRTASGVVSTPVRGKMTFEQDITK